MKTKFIYMLAFVCSAFVGTAYSLEMKPLVEVLSPAKVAIDKSVRDVNSEITRKTDFEVEGGVEFLYTAEFSEMRYGFGLAFRSSQRRGDDEATPAMIPLWLAFSFGEIYKERIFSPYVIARVGYVPLLTMDGNWWELPLNYVVNGGIGCVFPYGIGLEVLYDYVSVLKSFRDQKTEFRVSSGRLAIQVSVAVELFRDKIYNSQGR